MFVAKLLDLGRTSTIVWAQAGGGSDNETATALAVNGTSIYIAGAFYGTTHFGATTLTNSQANNENVFVAKLTDAGTNGGFTWAQGAYASATLGQQPPALAVSGTNIYVAGSFYGSSLAFGAIALQGAGSNTIFVAKLTDAGSTTSGFTWAQQSGATANGFVRGLLTDGASVYVSGYFGTSVISFGTTQLMNNGLANSTDVFIAKLTDMGTTGRFNWALRAGGAAEDKAASLTLTNGVVHVLGRFSGPASFGSVTLTNTNGCFLATLAQPALGTASANSLTGFSFFPNPAHGRATVQLPAGAGPATLTVLDALGRSVRTQAATAAKAELDLTGLALGFYAVRVQAGPHTATQRLVVE